MSVNGISSESLAAQGIPASSGSFGQNPRLAALERKLQRLNQEKKKAVENKDKEKARASDKINSRYQLGVDKTLLAINRVTGMEREELFECSL